MFKFPQGLYVDVRIEETFDTKITFKKKELQQQKIRSNKGAFIRVFDGKRWYYCSTTNVADIQGQIDTLAKLAAPDPNILQCTGNPLFSMTSIRSQTFPSGKSWSCWRAIWP
mgnify:CR=1 FL=1